MISFDPNIKVPSALSDVRIAQYNTKTLRLVLQRNIPLKSHISVKNSKIEIFYDPTKNNNQKANKERNYVKYKKSLASNKIIVIDAGHGGKDAGAIGSRKEYEKHVVLQIVLRTGKILQKEDIKFIIQELLIDLYH